MHTQDYLFQISRYFAYFESHLFYENSTGKFDINKQSEEFLKPILDLVFDGDFKRLEIVQENHPGIDLGDKEKKTAFQITSQTGYAKIKKTIEKIIKHKIFEDYDEFYHLVIDRKYETEKNQRDIDDFIKERIEAEKLPTETKVVFQLDTHLWNLKKLRAKIEELCSTEKLLKIVTHLKDNYGPVTELPTFNDALVPYQIAFEQQLDPSNHITSYQFHNDFFGRSSALETLKGFAENASEKLIIITAAGGTGKTRSCLEFFKQQTEQDESKVAFSLNDIHYDISKLRKAFNTDKQVFVLVDDAERMLPILSSLVDQAMRFENIKMIFTTRDSNYNDVVNSLQSHLKGHKRLPLDKLGYQETKALLTSQLPGREEQFIIGLSQRSNGIPLVILALADLVRQGVPIDSLTETEAFSNHVRRVTDQAIEQCHKETHIDSLSIAKVITVVAFLGPVRNDDNELQTLSNLSSVSLEDTIVILESLQNNGFLGRQDQQYAIKPDPYSDSILLTNSTRIKLWLRSQGLEEFRYRIIKNIIQVSDSSASTFEIETLMEDFIAYLSGVAERKDFKAVYSGLETIESFTYKKPELATTAVSKILAMLPKGDQEADLDFWFSVKRINDVHKKINDILSLAILISHGQDKLKRIFDLVTKLYEHSGDTQSLTKSFRYRVFDFYEFGHHPQIVCERQQFLVNQIKLLASQDSLTEDQQKIILSFSNILLSTEFSIEDFFESQTGKFSYGTATVPSNNEIKTIREKIILLLTSSFDKFTLENQGEILTTLIRKVSYMRKDMPNRYHNFDQSEELKHWLPFICDKIASGEYPEQRGKLIRKLQIAESFEIKEEFAEEVKKLRQLLFSAKNLEERLKTFLSFDHRVIESDIKAEVEDLLKQSGSKEDFFEMFESVRKGSNIFESQNLQLMLNELMVNHQQIAADFLDYAISKPFEAPDWYVTLSKAMFQDKQKFQQYVDFFWKKGDHASRSAVIWMLTSGRRGASEYFESSDLDFFDSAIDDKNIDAIRTLSYNLPEFLKIDSERVLNMVHKILDNEIGHHNHGMLLRWLFENENVQGVEQDHLKNFLFDKTEKLPLDHDFDSGIIYLEEKFGFETVLSFLVKKFDQAAQKDGIPASYVGYYYPSGKDTEQARIDRFILVLNEFATKDFDTYKELIKMFKPYEGFSQMLKDKLANNIKDLEAEKSKLIAFMKMLQVVDFVNPAYLAFIVEIGNLIESKYDSTTEELKEIFPLDFLQNTGSKSKSVAAMAFPEDLRRRDVINKILCEQELKTKIKSILESTLIKIEKAIKETEEETKKRLEQH